ncbi:MAG: sigma-70 family RNA polymerase sigma factor [Paramuribaculum sp.]|nr:sigma-70 family RNA polymerase sigma factor [Paramuribaculum sp.]
METATVQYNFASIQEKLFSFAYRLTSNREDAYDLVQDTALKIIENKDKYTQDTNFKGWALTIMRNIFINNYRKTSRASVIMDSTDDEYYINLSQEPGVESPESSYTASEVVSALNEFPDIYRIPFSMFISGYSYPEIAEKMNLALGTVKSRIFNVRQKLQSRFSDYC